MEAWIIGLHLLSFHIHPGFETATVGIYARSPEGITAGALRNSEGRFSAYLGYTAEWGPMAVTVGGIGGYKRGEVQPLLIPSVKIPFVNDVAARLSFIPSPGRGGSAALHLSFEINL